MLWVETLSSAGGSEEGVEKLPLPVSDENRDAEAVGVDHSQILGTVSVQVPGEHAAGAAPDARYHWFRSKWRAETAVRESGTTYVILRPSWVYGPEDRSLNRMLRLARMLPFAPIIGAGSKQRLQPVFIDDVGRAVAEAVDNPAADPSASSSSAEPRHR